MSRAKNPLTKYIRIFLFGWVLIILIIGAVGFGLVWNDYRSKNAEVGYWNKLQDQIGKETVIRQINEFPKDK